jgi:hypothetical protein
VPALEVADIFRRHGEAFRQAHAGHLGRTERRVMGAIAACRTAALGGHAEYCEECGFLRCVYNSCLMGKFRNGESAHDRRGAAVVFRRSRSPLRFGSEHGDQLVRWPEGSLAQMGWNNGLDGFELLGGITARVDFGSRQIAVPEP